MISNLAGESLPPFGQMSELGQRRKCRCFEVTSALPLKADINGRDCEVRFVPKAEATCSAQ
jgi:hypothetical protein